MFGDIDMGNAAQEHIAGIQAQLSRAERDVIGLGIHSSWTNQSWKRCYRVGDSTIG